MKIPVLSLLVLFTGVFLSLSGCKPEAKKAPSIEKTVWVVEDIGGKGIIDNSHLTLTLDGEGRVSGHSGCNRYMGQYDISDNTLTFPGALAGTRMACMAEAMMNQEGDYLTILSAVTEYELTPEGALLLYTPDGATIRFMPEEPQK